MPSVTSWTRLEPHNRTPAMTGFAARVGDPLWMLTRQWQLGELTGADTGSPTRVDLTATTAVLSRFRPGLPDGTAGVPLDVRMPLEALVEAEPATGPADDRAAAVAGADLLARLGSLAGALRSSLVKAYPLPVPDPNAAPMLLRRAELLRRRVPDGRALHTAVATAQAGGDASTALTGLDRSDATAVAQARTAASDWLAAWPAGPLTAGTTPPAWRPDRVEYEFAVAAAGTTAADERVLATDSHQGGPLDWWSVDAYPGATLGAAADGTAQSRAVSMLPTRLAATGAPSPRFWAFEPGHVNLDAVTAAPEDLGRLLFMEFAVLYGNDFFMVPLTVAVGSVTTITGLTVTTTFGETVTVPPAWAADQAGGRSILRLFESAAAQGSGRPAGLAVLPGAVAPLGGEPVEEVILTRDQMANVAWAIERTVAGLDGRAAERAEALYRIAAAAADTAPPQGPHYQLVSQVPANWMPMLPSATDAAGRARPVLRLSGQPQGELLATGAEVVSHRLSRAGIRLARRVQRVRATDGRVVVWMSRRSGPGRGESSSGLRFDAVVGSRTDG
jgi:hypothetical protein